MKVLQSKAKASKQSRGSVTTPPNKGAFMMTDATFKEDIKLDEKIKKETLLPKKYKVIVLNDNQTPMEWVISILTEIFKHSQAQAEQLTLAIHSEGSAIAGIYSYEIAEQKSVEATMLSRNNGFPLAFKLEQE